MLNGAGEAYEVVERRLDATLAHARHTLAALQNRGADEATSSKRHEPLDSLIGIKSRKKLAVEPDRHFPAASFVPSADNPIIVSSATSDTSTSSLKTASSRSSPATTAKSSSNCRAAFRFPGVLPRVFHSSDGRMTMILNKTASGEKITAYAIKNDNDATPIPCDDTVFPEVPQQLNSKNGKRYGERNKFTTSLLIGTHSLTITGRFKNRTLTVDNLQRMYINGECVWD
ncbi:unnamed protein product [Caenorhabditis bovis]|uniref:Uncharacterized protein n=1 Tax=Caenorhabditis bovis TaxID=2654633 RepID=A0A8S1EAE5_9PELO|nr:unnamed protein product [Caenorhabditis bovis]